MNPAGLTTHYIANCKRATPPAGWRFAEARDYRVDAPSQFRDPTSGWQLCRFTPGEYDTEAWYYPRCVPANPHRELHEDEGG